MKKRTVLAALAAIAAAALLLPTSSVGAQDNGTAPVFILHGLNLDGQDTPGGSNVTVCVGTEDVPLIADFEFGEFFGPASLEIGSELDINVWGGADVPCDEDGVPLIEQTVTVPASAAMLVATVDEEENAVLEAYPVDTDCTEDDNGRLSAYHATGAVGTVDLVVAGEPVDDLSFPQSLIVDVPAGDYPVEVLEGEETLVDTTLTVTAAENLLVVVVGGIAGEGTSPVVALVQDIEVGTCDTPTPTPDPDPEPVPTPTPVGDGATPAAATGDRPLALTG